MSGFVSRHRRLLLVLLLVTVLALATPNALADTKSFKSTQTGTHTVQGAILDTYRSIGGHTSLLGYPRTDELPTPFTVGRAVSMMMLSVLSAISLRSSPSRCATDSIALTLHRDPLSMVPPSAAAGAFARASAML